MIQVKNEPITHQLIIQSVKPIECKNHDLLQIRNVSVTTCYNIARNGRLILNKFAKCQ